MVVVFSLQYDLFSCLLVVLFLLPLFLSVSSVISPPIEGGKKERNPWEPRKAIHGKSLKKMVLKADLRKGNQSEQEKNE